MTEISVRLTKEEKIALEKYGKISDIVHDALRIYINNKKSAESLKKLRKYQKKNHVTTTAEEIVRLIKKDRELR